MNTVNNLKRLNNLEKLIKCSQKGKGFIKLSLKEKKIVYNFISENSELNENEFKHKANHLYTNDFDRSKHYVEIMEVLMMIA